MMLRGASRVKVLPLQAFGRIANFAGVQWVPVMFILESRDRCTQTRVDIVYPGCIQSLPPGGQGEFLLAGDAQ